jgi:WD40 repeat protein
MAAKKTTKAVAKKGGASLESTLAELGASAKGTRTPATKADFEAIAKCLGDVPADLRALFEWARNLDALFKETSLEWLNPIDGAKAAKLNRESEAPASFFPIATDGAGNYSCFDAATGRVMDWDHETRKATSLAKDLSAYLDKVVVTGLKRAARDAEKEKKHAKAEAVSGGAIRLPRALPATPSKIAPIRNTVRAGSCVFVNDDEVVAAGQTTNIDHLGTRSRRAIDSRSNNAAVDREREQLVLVDFGEMSLVELTSGKLIARWQAPLGHWSSVLLTADGALACTYSTKPTIDLWDLHRGKGIPALGAINAYTASYELPKGEPIATLAGHTAWVRRARFDASGELLASCDSEGTLCLWDVASRSQIASEKVSKTAAVGVDFSLDGQSVYVASEDGSVVILDRAGKKRGSLRFSAPVSDLRVLANGMLAVALQPTIDGFHAAVLALATADKGKILAEAAPLKKTVMARISDMRGDLILLTAESSTLFRVT